jgi:hypothetical protein
VPRAMGGNQHPVMTGKLEGVLPLFSVPIAGGAGRAPAHDRIQDGLDDFRGHVMPPIAIIDVKDVGLSPEEMLLPKDFRGDDHFMVR